MAFNRSVIACQCDITKCLRLVKVVQHRQEVVLVIVPLEAEHLGQGVHLGDGELGQQTEKKAKMNNYVFVEKSKFIHMQFVRYHQITEIMQLDNHRIRIWESVNFIYLIPFLLSWQHCNLLLQ